MIEKELAQLLAQVQELKERKATTREQKEEIK